MLDMVPFTLFRVTHFTSRPPLPRHVYPSTSALTGTHMESRVKVAGPPLHQLLIAFPLRLLATAVVFAVIFLVTDNATWAQAAFYMIGAGVITGLMAAVPGALDWLAIPGVTRAKRVGLIHGVGNVIVVALFAVSWLLRRDDPTLPPTEAVVAGLVGAGIVAVTGWLGES